MAITLEDINALDESTFTPELQAALFPKVAPGVKSWLESTGHIIKPKEEFDTEFNTALEAKKKEFADSEAPRFYGSMDQMLKAVGYQKPNGVSTAAWVEKLSAEGKLPFTDAQKEKIVKAMKGELVSEKQKGLADQYLQELNDYKQQQTAAEQKNWDNALNQMISGSLKAASVPIDPNLKDDTAKATARKTGVDTINAVFRSIYEGAKDDDGVIYFKKKGSDAAIMDIATGEPMSPLDIMKKDHPSLFAPVGHQQKGVGTNTDAPDGGKAQPNSLQSIHNEAQKLGLRMFSEPWKKYVEDEKTRLGIK